MSTSPEQHPKAKVLSFALLCRSTTTTTAGIKATKAKPGYSIYKNGTLTPNNWIIEQLKNYREDLNFQNGIGCKALHEYLELDYRMTVNHKKIYRLCKENDLLLQKKKKIKRIKKLASKIKITGPNQIWHFDIKYGHIHGENRPFYFVAFVEVFTKKVISYHLGLHCKAGDLRLALKIALSSV